MVTLINRILNALTYITLLIAGFRTVFWLPAHIYSEFQIIALDITGVITIVSSLVCLIALLTYKWRWEYVSVWFVVLGISGYALTSAVTRPPQPITEFVSLIALALCLSLSVRGVSLLKFAQETKLLKGE